MSTRRMFLRNISATALTAGLLENPAADLRASEISQSDDRPRRNSTHSPKNVVLIVCDDLGFGDLGCFGGSFPTPNLDKLAEQGARFTHFNAAHPICSASRAALLTGRYAQRSGTRGAYFPHAKGGMSLAESTLADLFRGAGFVTKAVGKWHLGDAAEYLPTNRGFDSYLGVPYSVDMEPLPLMRDLEVIETETDRAGLTGRYTEEALNFLRLPKEHPFFLYMAYSYPHDPAKASPKFRGSTRCGDYGDAIHEIDWSVGEIVAQLDRMDARQETLLLFTSDHGPWYQGSPGGLRGRKASTFEGGFRVPLIASWPGVIREKLVQAAPCSNLDIVPTLTKLCSLSPSPNPLDGLDISGLLTGAVSSVPRRATLYFTPAGSGNDLHCARQGQYKVRFGQHDGEIYINDYTEGKLSYALPRPELYDVTVDPSESYNIAGQHPEVVRQILEDVEEQVTGMPDVVQQAFAALRKNVAGTTTPPGATPRQNDGKPEPSSIWIPEDRRQPAGYWPSDKKGETT